MRATRTRKGRTILPGDMPCVRSYRREKRGKNERCLIMHDKTNTSDKYGLLVTPKGKVTEKLPADAIYIS